MNKKYLGSDFDDFLKKEKLDSANIVAIKRVIAYQMLDPENASITLFTLERAASALGKKLSVQLV